MNVAPPTSAVSLPRSSASVPVHNGNPKPPPGADPRQQSSSSQRRQPRRRPRRPPSRTRRRGARPHRNVARMRCAGRELSPRVGHRVVGRTVGERELPVPGDAVAAGGARLDDHLRAGPHRPHPPRRQRGLGDDAPRVGRRVVRPRRRPTRARPSCRPTRPTPCPSTPMPLAGVARPVAVVARAKCRRPGRTRSA